MILQLGNSFTFALRGWNFGSRLKILDWLVSSTAKIIVWILKADLCLHLFFFQLRYHVNLEHSAELIKLFCSASTSIKNTYLKIRGDFSTYVAIVDVGLFISANQLGVNWAGWLSSPDIAAATLSSVKIFWCVHVY